jgi:branched-chain amino acid transport system substrate-binding protein
MFGRTQTRRALGLIAVTALLLAACGPSQPAETTAPPPATEAPGDTTTTTAPSETTTTAPAEPIRIGALTSLTGPFTAWGVQVRDGMQLAVNEINAAGGVGGRMLELVVTDDQSNAEEATTGFERLVEREGVVAIGGTISSDVGLATSRLAEELEVPLFLVKAGSEQILTQNSRYTFRTCLPAAPMVAGPVLQYAQEQGLDKVGAIIADYAWGQAIRSALVDTFEGSGIELQVEVAPIGEQDFTTYLRSLQQFGPGMISATGHPPGTGAITVQSADLGLDVPIAGSWTPWSLVMGGVAEAGIGRYADYKCADFFSDSYLDLARRYLEMSDNPLMEDDAVAGYGIVQMVAQAIEAVGDDPAAIAEWLHGQSFDLPGYAHPMGWTEWGELAEAAPILAIVSEGPAPEGINEAGDWWLELLVRSDPLTPYTP